MPLALAVPDPSHFTPSALSLPPPPHVPYPHAGRSLHEMLQLGLANLLPQHLSHLLTTLPLKKIIYMLYERDNLGTPFFHLMCMCRHPRPPSLLPALLNITKADTRTTIHMLTTPMRRQLPLHLSAHYCTDPTEVSLLANSPLNPRGPHPVLLKNDSGLTPLEVASRRRVQLQPGTPEIIRVLRLADARERRAEVLRLARPVQREVYLCRRRYMAAPGGRPDLGPIATVWGRFAMRVLTHWDVNAGPVKLIVDFCGRNDQGCQLLNIGKAPGEVLERRVKEEEEGERQRAPEPIFWARERVEGGTIKYECRICGGCWGRYFGAIRHYRTEHFMECTRGGEGTRKRGRWVAMGDTRERDWNGAKGTWGEWGGLDRKPPLPMGQDT